MKKYLLLSCLIVVLSMTVFFFYFNPQKDTNTDPESATSITRPGSLAATLTLADGSKILLDSTGGQMPREPVSATVSTPRGGQYRLTLADGTIILMNTATTIKFPFDYGKKERRIELSGEAYFEVAENRKVPFRVGVNGVDVLSLGTAFNIMAYPEETMIKATLMKGTIQVSKNKSSRKISAGHQAIVAGNDIKVMAIDPDEETAWRKNNFEEGNSDYLLRQISRWYNVEVIYEGISSVIPFEGTLARDMELKNVVNMLQLNGVPATLDNEGKRIIVKGEK